MNIGARPKVTNAVMNLQVKIVLKRRFLSYSGSDSIFEDVTVKPRSIIMPMNCKKDVAVTYQPNLTVPSSRVNIATAARPKAVLKTLPMI